jgi:hypothetical protein
VKPAAWSLPSSRLLHRTLAAALTLTLLSGCGSAENHRKLSVSPSSPQTTSNPQTLANGPAFGLTEDNANLLWSPDRPPRPADGFQRARLELTALHPSYVRLLVDWAALQPDPTRPPALEALVSGCAREVAPCGPYAGIRDELAAIASQQRAAGTGAQAFQVVIEILGTPAWAARAPSGCEGAHAHAFSRTPSPAAIGGYRALIRSLLALGAREGVALEWWSPWNEPDDPAFISPQRSSCATGSAPLSPALYAELARAMAAELRADGGVQHLLLGELNGFPTASPERTSVSEFVAALPSDVVCLSEVWSIHAYASDESATPAADPVKALERALDARGPCGRGARIWVTEAGAGARHPGSPRPPGAAAEQAGCEALAEQLLAWYRDRRIGAVLQYTFRDDPAYPVGLISSDLSHLYATYRLWLTWARRRGAGQPPPAGDAACA